jgi:hypothetical protein
MPLLLPLMILRCHAIIFACLIAAAADLIFAAACHAIFIAAARLFSLPLYFSCHFRDA